MASPFQQQALVRKLVYLGLILVLFTASFLYRTYLILPQANALALREETKGEVELTGSAVRLTLTGSRGLAVCFLWMSAQNKQKKHEWNELELIVSSVAKLQPHFITPWLFQSWNMSFNVSVECDSPHDKYFYISRGMQLLAEGERRNRGSKDSEAGIDFPGNPDLRFHMGFFYQLKIGQSDETRTLRSLYQMSCMDPHERDPARLEVRGSDGRRRVDLVKFEAFCKNHPRLVRRLREQLKDFDTPESIVEFLRDHQEIPSRYDLITNKLKDNAKDRFPILPPRFRADEPYDNDDRDGSRLGDDFDNFIASRAWYAYAQEPLPPPDKNFGVGGWNYDPRRYRLPRMSHYIFRQYPALAQGYVAEQLAKEGWFDHRGWVITSRGGKPEWFFDSQGNERDVVVGRSNKYSSARAWEKAFKLYSAYGKETRLLMIDQAVEWYTDSVKRFGRLLAAGSLSPLRLPPGPHLRLEAPPPLARDYITLSAQSDKFVDHYRERGIVNPPTRLPAAEATPELVAGLRAHLILQALDHNRTITNFRNHYYQVDAERTDLAVRARKEYYEAERLWVEPNHRLAIATYRKWIEGWKKLLVVKPQFRDNTNIEEESYENQLRFLRRFQDFKQQQLRQLFIGVAQSGLAQAGLPLNVSVLLANKPIKASSSARLRKLRKEDPSEWKRVQTQLAKWEKWRSDRRARIIPTKNIWGPFDGRDRFGRSFFDRNLVEQVRQKIMYPNQRKKVMQPPPGMRGPPNMGPGGMGPGMKPARRPAPNRP
jgi:hypothetical protein